MWDVIVVGAGISGITAAQRLSQAGYRVLVLDKSRGLGGRMATRRVTWPQGDSPTVAVDHGCRLIERPIHSGESWLTAWINQGLLQPWTPTELTLDANGVVAHRTPQEEGTPPYYDIPQGMSALVKAMATGLSIQRHSRVTQVLPLPQGWRVDWVNDAVGHGVGSGPEATTSLEARALVLALPAAQIVPILTPAVAHQAALAPLIAAAAAVMFDPIVTVMAGYPPDTPAVVSGLPAMGPAFKPGSDVPSPDAFPPQESVLNGAFPGGWMVWGEGHPVLRWVILDSSKRPQPPYPVVVAHSTATFAEAHFDAADLSSVGREMLASATTSLGPWLAQPDWVQVHRWRYGLVKQAHPAEVLYTEAVPTLAGCGDWCVGTGLNEAVISGEAAAQRILEGLTTDSSLHRG